VIYDYYQKKIKSKPKKQALGAVMNKLVRIIFSVLKNKHPFVMITPEEQIKLYRSKAA
ncbi:MAG TPA: IS110 family transposase, partial [Tepidanaerobacter syntrophicus]|nr:IS110 family transposase [Tepidanaerobacter syntrophicus]